jgi:Zn-finger nucleic acid-binding protein
LLCPETGCVLVRFSVGQGLRFQIERSPKSGGVWLDAGEWEALKSRELHSELHLIFTAPYQKRIRTELFRAQLNERFKSRIGDADFEKAGEIKSWILQHPKRRDIVAFLIDEDEA